MFYTTESRANYNFIKFETDSLDGVLSSTFKSDILNFDFKSQPNMILDLTKLRYCDSAALSSFLVAQKYSNNEDGKFVVFGASDMVSELIEITKLNEVLTIKSSLEEAEEVLTASEEN